MAYKNTCKNRLEENKARYKNAKNRTKKEIANSLRKKDELLVNTIEQKTK